MRNRTQDSFARTRVSSSTPFDCELPPDARAEFFKPKRPVMLRQPPRQPPDRFGAMKLACAVGLALLILAAVIGHYTQSHAVQHTAAPVVQLTPAPVTLPTPIPAQSFGPPPPAVVAPRARLVLYKRWMGHGVYEIPDSTGRVVKNLVDPAPRALLANPPAPKAELVQTDGPQGSEQAYSFTMPYDGSFEVIGTLRGYLADVGQLPRTGNRIGDAWSVNGVSWVWITVPGTTAPTWVDPRMALRSVFSR